MMPTIRTVSPMTGNCFNIMMKIQQPAFWRQYVLLSCHYSSFSPWVNNPDHSVGAGLLFPSEYYPQETPSPCLTLRGRSHVYCHICAWYSVVLASKCPFWCSWNNSLWTKLYPSLSTWCCTDLELIVVGIETFQSETQLITIFKILYHLHLPTSMRPGVRDIHR
ncbi:hypothetical protein K474DRAFT_758852 [Panus rudis PR-1116 ss-1]|nr:hypothetical protein K474DRAFT_758852 [Panus rudis PR-1116 ss-1]